MKAITTLTLLLATAIGVVAQPPMEGFLRIQDIDNTIAVDLMYAKSDNFVGEVMYDFTEAYLHPKAAYAVAEANRLLGEAHPGWRLCIYDATRPMRVQQIMWVHTERAG